jgi:hypothetical protein
MNLKNAPARKLQRFFDALIREGKEIPKNSEAMLDAARNLKTKKDRRG